MILHDSTRCHVSQTGRSAADAHGAEQTGAGHPRVYSDRLFLKALVIMIVRHLHKVNERLRVLAQPTAEMAILHGLPSRTGALPGTSHLGTALKVAAGYIARANWVAICST